MSANSSRYLLTFLFNVVYWTVLFTFVLAIRFYKIGAVGYTEIDLTVPSARIYGNGIILGILVGLPYTAMEFYLKNKGIYQHSLVQIILNRTGIQSLITVVVLVLIAYINVAADYRQGIIERDPSNVMEYLRSPTLLLLFLSAFGGHIGLSLFRALQMKIGEELFYDLLLGRFRPAREEERAFLFIDLKSSTTIAELLGHEKYSYFIQDCFGDLHFAVMSTNAQVYQYVGDEAVITWLTPTAAENNNCLRCFFAFEEQLERRREHYISTYGMMPEFKGGVNVGKVMTAEVGVIKRDIAYHSDVLNTAARIQHLCKEKDAKVLVSAAITELMPKPAGFNYTPRGNVLLKGKNKKVEIFEVSEAV